VIKVEGLRSYKAIAFIKRKNKPRNTQLAKNYFTLRMSLQKAQILSVRKTSREYFNKKLGDKKWIK
jgi:hypothetical protein